jgi:hypothetical protein
VAKRAEVTRRTDHPELAARLPEAASAGLKRANAKLSDALISEERTGSAGRAPARPSSQPKDGRLSPADAQKPAKDLNRRKQRKFEQKEPKRPGRNQIVLVLELVLDSLEDVFSWKQFAVRKNSPQGVAFAVAKPKAGAHNAREPQVASFQRSRTRTSSRTMREARPHSTSLRNSKIVRAMRLQVAFAQSVKSPSRQGELFSERF